jgi:hypothetical protein
MSWAAYDERVRRAWTTLLDAHPTERQVQRFLEQHPALVPGAHAAFGTLTSGHAPFPCALITQPPLRGITTRTPDFLWISTDSAFLNPVFIEIEAPEKRWLTAKGHRHHELTEALHQLDEWEEWCSEPANRQIFFESYRVPALLRRRKWQPLWVLIFGRRAEDPERVSRLRARLRTESRIVLPYERVSPDEQSDNYLCARQSAGRYIAVSVPPTVRLGPNQAESWALIEGKEHAASVQQWSSPERRAFLMERFAYWDGWAAGESGIISTADLE